MILLKFNIWYKPHIPWDIQEGINLNREPVYQAVTSVLNGFAFIHLSYKAASRTHSLYVHERQLTCRLKKTLVSCLIVRCEVLRKSWLLKTVLFCNLKVERLPEMENIYHLYACVHLTVAHKIAKSHVVFQNFENSFGKSNLIKRCKKQLLLSLQLSWQTKVMHSSFHSRTTSNHSIDDAPSD